MSTEGTDTRTGATTIDPGRLYTVPELAELTGESRRYFWWLRRSRQIAVVEMPGKRLRIRGSDWLEFVEDSVIPAELLAPLAESEPEPETRPVATRRKRPPRRVKVPARRAAWKDRVGI